MRLSSNGGMSGDEGHNGLQAPSFHELGGGLYYVIVSAQSGPMLHTPRRQGLPAMAAIVAIVPVATPRKDCASKRTNGLRPVDRKERPVSAVMTPTSARPINATLR